MSTNDDLRLAWIAHREGNASRRDALLTLAVAAGEPEGASWVFTVRDYLVKVHPSHLYSRFTHLDEALADRRVIASLERLRLSFPPSRVRSLVKRADVVRGPYTGRKAPAAILLDDMLAPPRAAKSQKTGTFAMIAPNPVASNGGGGSAESADSIVPFYLNVLLGVAVLCALVLEDSHDGKRAA